MKESTAKPGNGQGRSSEVARALIRRTKQASRRRFRAEEKIRILLEGSRAELSVAELCRREGIQPIVHVAERLHGGRQGAAAGGEPPGRHDCGGARPAAGE